MSDLITFNTGRHYSPEGQIIEAEGFHQNIEDILEDLTPYVIFNDKTRKIKGKIMGCTLVEDEIMLHYDSGNYEQI